MTSLDPSDPESGTLSWGVSIAWMSTLYHPDEGYEPTIGWDGSIGIADDLEDGEEPSEPTPADRGQDDVRQHSAWRQWLVEDFRRDDVFLMIRVDDDPPKRKFTHGYSKKEGRHTFVNRVAAQEFLERDQRSVIRTAMCELYAHAAEKLGAPAPPPALIETPV